MKSWFQFLQTLLFFTIILGGAEWGCARLFCIITESELGYYPLLGLGFSFNAFIALLVCGKNWTDEEKASKTLVRKKRHKR